MNNTSNKYKLSIITCCYNSEKYIEETILSVKNQTFQDFEHIFIDAFSNDNTLNIIEKHKNQNTKIIQSEPKGISNAMNIGISHAEGEFLLFLHADDLLYSNKVLMNVFEFIKNKNNNWFYGRIYFKSNNKKNEYVYPDKFYHKYFSYFLLKLTNYIAHPSVFIKRKIFQKYGTYDETLTYSMDHEYWLRIGKKEAPYYIPQIISYFREGGISTRSENSELIKNEYKIISQKYNIPSFFTEIKKFYSYLKK